MADKKFAFARVLRLLLSVSGSNKRRWREMGTAEELAFSLREEGHGVHALLWDATDDLVHALLVLRASVAEMPVYPLLMAGEQSFAELQKYINSRCPIQGDTEAQTASGATAARSLAFIFLPQASSRHTGGWL